MYLMKCGTSDIYNNFYLPATMVEGWTSLIWTERFIEAGEFQLKTPKVAETLDLIPDGSLVCINESRSIMRVETHSIAYTDDGKAELTVSGRTLETFLENRQIKSDFQLPYPMLKNYSVLEAVGVLIYNAIRNPLLGDVTGGPFAHDPAENCNWEVRAMFPNISVQKAQSTADPPDITDLQSKIEWYLQSGDVYKTVLDWMKLGEFGIRVERPVNVGGSCYTVASDGTISQPSGNIGQMTIVLEMYNGKNRTIFPSTVDPHTPIIFRHDAGHIDSPNYLFSRKDYKNYARVLSSDGEVYVWNGDDGYLGATTNGVTPPTGAPVPAPTGLNRYELFVDAGNVDPAVVDSNAWMRQQGKAALKAHNRAVALDGAITARGAQLYPYDPNNFYGTSYYLGDLVTVMGEYDVAETMQVQEYVRSQDKDGYKAYPTLVRQDPTV